MPPAAAQQHHAAGAVARRLQSGRLCTHMCDAWFRTEPVVVASSTAARNSSSSSHTGRVAQAVPDPAVLVTEHQNLPHVSVLLNEVLHNLNHLPIKVYVDCTLGAGGHMAAMIKQHRELQLCVGIDVDPAAHQLAAARLQPLLAAARQAAPALHQLKGNYCDVVPLLSQVPAPVEPSSSSSSSSSNNDGPVSSSLVGHVDAMLLDLGVSSMQLDSADRGFSFMADGPVDMRMDPTAGTSAEELINTASEAELGRLIRDYGEEKSWKAVARRIVAAREVAPIRTTKQLVGVIGQTQLRSSRGSSRQQNCGSSKGIHPATRTFQALRIAVNDEIVKLEKALPAAISCLSPGGRLAVISFHSLEDRLVKHAFLTAAGRPTPAQEFLVHGLDGWRVLDSLAAAAQGRLVTRKPVLPSEQEIAANPRSRSAKLRVFEKARGEAATSPGGQVPRGKRKRPRGTASEATPSI